MTLLPILLRKSKEAKNQKHKKTLPHAPTTSTNLFQGGHAPSIFPSVTTDNKLPLPNLRTTCPLVYWIPPLFATKTSLLQFYPLSPAISICSFLLDHTNQQTSCYVSPKTKALTRNFSQPPHARATVSLLLLFTAKFLKRNQSVYCL